MEHGSKPESFILHGDNRTDNKAELSQLEERFFSLAQYLFNNLQHTEPDLESLSDVQSALVNMYRAEKETEPNLDFPTFLVMLESHKVAWVQQSKSQRTVDVLKEINDTIAEEVKKGGFAGAGGSDQVSISLEVDEFLARVGGPSYITERRRIAGLGEPENLKN